MSRVTAAGYSGYEALSPRPSYYLSATREIFASCDMSLRNLQITITIHVCYAKKRLPKPNVGYHKMFLKNIQLVCFRFSEAEYFVKIFGRFDQMLLIYIYTTNDSITTAVCY